LTPCRAAALRARSRSRSTTATTSTSGMSRRIARWYSAMYPAPTTATRTGPGKAGGGALSARVEGSRAAGGADRGTGSRAAGRALSARRAAPLERDAFLRARRIAARPAARKRAPEGRGPRSIHLAISSFFGARFLSARTGLGPSFHCACGRRRKRGCGQKAVRDRALPLERPRGGASMAVSPRPGWVRRTPSRRARNSRSRGGPPGEESRSHSARPCPEPPTDPRCPALPKLPSPSTASSSRA
jgi:hypothetical protein